MVLDAKYAFFFFCEEIGLESVDGQGEREGETDQLHNFSALKDYSDSDRRVTDNVVFTQL